jgi:predicted phosphodiesterase
MFRAVYGNIDGQDIRLRYKKELVFEIEDVKVFMTHIGGYPGKYASNAIDTINSEKPKLFVCGHSHILRVKYDQKRNMLCVNPGAAGRYGMQQVRTLLRFTIDGETIKDMEVIELGEK